MHSENQTLGAAGLRRFAELRNGAVEAVAKRFHAEAGSLYARSGQRGLDACREDLGFHLEFLRPVLEFGITQPMVDYLRWLASVLATRDVPAEHLPRSLDWLAEYFAANMDGPDADAVVASLAETKARFLEVDETPSAIYGLMPKPWPEHEAFEGALISGDRRGATLLLDRCLNRGLGLVEAELHMIQPALYSIGTRWQNNLVTVAQEHLATAIAQSVMTYGLQRSAAPEPNGKRVLLACVSGNNHSIGLQMVSDAFELDGWETQYLGGNVPTNALLRQIDEFQPELLALSVSFAQQLQVVKATIATLVSTLGDARPAVIVGGLAINQFSRLADRLGADATGSDARAAVERGLAVVRQGVLQ